MIKIGIASSIADIRAKLNIMRDDIMDKAVVRALNKTAAEVKVEASRRIRDAGYNIKASAIKRQIDIRKASRSDLRAIVRAAGRSIPLIEYGARETSNGVTVSVKSGRKLIRHAFIATMPGGHKGVFIRIGKDHKKVMRNGKQIWSGLPIKELYGPSIPAAFSNQVVQDALQSKIAQRFPRLLEHEVVYLLSK